MAFAPILRILCLHDARSNATELKESLKLLGERLYLNHGIDLVFVNSPLVVVDTNGLSSSSADDDVTPKRVWWHESNDSYHSQQFSGVNCIFDKEDEGGVEADVEHVSAEDGQLMKSSSERHEQQQHQHSYPGLDASLLLLQQLWASSPFIGILAVGQGAAIASLFSLLPTTFPPPRLAIFVHDYQTESHLLLQESTRLQDSMQCLHVLLSEKPAVELNHCQSLLVAQFGGTVLERVRDISHENVGLTSSLAPVDMNAMGRFLLQQKRTLNGKLHLENVTGESNIVALQTALHSAQLQAADMIAEHIAAHPPAALMAVIRPAGEVAGWAGDKRRQANEEGGGAPCPSEFLLHREKRQGHGVSRQHPRQQEADPTGSADNI
ncbi:hypothetical protein MPSEU_000801000 [Mayamaea pseudoterrestris]|nr:hypothetical protein MPSEU_000801000 [Mayamaea pseudoterrestris]